MALMTSPCGNVFSISLYAHPILEAACRAMIVVVQKTILCSRQ